MQYVAIKSGNCPIKLQLIRLISKFIVKSHPVAKSDSETARVNAPQTSLFNLNIVMDCCIELKFLESVS